MGKHRHLYSSGGSAIFGDFPKLARWSSGKPHPSPKSFQPCLLPLELAGSDSLAPSILCRLPLKAPKTFLPVKAGGADAAVGRRVSRRPEKVTPRLQFPNECEGTGCLNTLPTLNTQSWLLMECPVKLHFLSSYSRKISISC